MSTPILKGYAIVGILLFIGLAFAPTTNSLAINDEYPVYFQLMGNERIVEKKQRMLLSKTEYNNLQERINTIFNEQKSDSNRKIIKELYSSITRLFDIKTIKNEYNAHQPYNNSIVNNRAEPYQNWTCYWTIIRIGDDNYTLGPHRMLVNCLLAGLAMEFTILPMYIVLALLIAVWEMEYVLPPEITYILITRLEKLLNRSLHFFYNLQISQYEYYQPIIDFYQKRTFFPSYFMEIYTQDYEIAIEPNVAFLLEKGTDILHYKNWYPRILGFHGIKISINSSDYFIGRGTRLHWFDRPPPPWPP